ncbi:MAG: hypothetical protein G5Z42_06000 [Caldisphaeraceae archaeon]|nr:hypothetical protein [Caldisphaeraceae archaeon]MEB3798350.1 hypothetical protein [Caldisphaeraceae archaeon]
MLHRRLYRIYYTVYDDKVNEIVISSLEKKYGSKVNVINSKLVPEFRALELYLDKKGLSDEIKELVSSIINSKYVRVDYIDTSQ